MKNLIKEIIIFALVAISSIFILGYSMHMFVGGLVEKNTEILIIIIACFIGAIAISFLAWDIVRNRRRRNIR
jgi:peptidoglycan/LPS O-acetylase OafA/YrhL